MIFFEGVAENMLSFAKCDFVMHRVQPVSVQRYNLNLIYKILYSAKKVMVSALIRKVIVAVTEHPAGSSLLSNKTAH